MINVLASFLWKMASPVRLAWLGNRFPTHLNADWSSSQILASPTSLACRDRETVSESFSSHHVKAEMRLSTSGLILFSSMCGDSVLSPLLSQSAASVSLSPLSRRFNFVGNSFSHLPPKPWCYVQTSLEMHILFHVAFRMRLLVMLLLLFTFCFMVGNWHRIWEE